MSMKKIIAKEGLILLTIVILGLAVYFIGRYLNAAYLSEHVGSRFKVVQNMRYCLVGYTPYMRAMSFGLNIALFGYPVVVLTRFIFWAIRTLKEEKSGGNK
jgi:hypothetical protein